MVVERERFLTIRTGAIALAILAATASSAYCEDAPKSVVDTEATDGLPDDVKPIVAPVPNPRPDDSKLADSIDSREQGG